MVLITTVAIVAYIACLGCPAERIMALSPIYRWVMMLPRIITSIYS